MTWVFEEARKLVKCPRCNALPEEYCRTPRGKYTEGRKPHMERIQEVLRMQTNHDWNRCDQCGRTVTNEMFSNGSATRIFIDGEWETFCPRCRKYNI